jgi:hypothetical protein
VSPRHFEAAAFRTAQILYEGRYSGILQPWHHYIPLRKDFANFDEAIAAFRNKALTAELIENAYRDLVASGAYSYARFIAAFDRRLEDLGLKPDTGSDQIRDAAGALARDARRARPARYVRNMVLLASGWQFPGRRKVVEIAQPFLLPLVERVRAWASPTAKREA